MIAMKAMMLQNRSRVKSCVVEKLEISSPFLLNIYENYDGGCFFSTSSSYSLNRGCRWGIATNKWKDGKEVKQTTERKNNGN